MSTNLLSAEIALSKEIGDYWSSTTTSNGAADGTTIVDTALKAKENDWVTDEAFDFIDEGTYDQEERKISSLDKSTGTLTVLAHGGQIVSGIDYRVHRLFSASDKRLALIAAAKNIWPALYQEIWDETLVIGNWLNDGSFERWTTTANPTVWVDTTVTATQISTSPYYRHGAYSCKLDTAAGTVAQSITSFDDLKNLRGKNVTFTIQAWCDTASCLRISINDGATQTYSSYHAGDDAWTQDNPRNDSMYVTQYIDSNATNVTFTIHHEIAAATSYVDDARAISDYRSRLYIGNLGLAQNQPTQVQMERCYYSQREPWVAIHGYVVDKDGYLYIPTNYPSDYRIRIKGKGYLDFLLSGSSSTDWAATIAIDDPQLKILTAEAALYLYTQMAMPNYETGARREFQQMMQFWKQESVERRAKFGMYGRAGASVHWGVQ